MKARSFLVFCSALPACSSAAARGGQTGEENFGCVIVEEQELGANEVSPIGVAPNDVLALVSEPALTQLRWSASAAPSGEPSTEVHLLFHTRESSGARYVRQEPGTERELALDCSAYVAVTGTLLLRTADGSFDETWHTALRARTPSRADASITVQWDALNGTYDFGPLVPEGYSALDGSVQLAFEGSGGGRAVTGAISGVAQQQQGDAVNATFHQVGTIGDDVAGR